MFCPKCGRQLPESAVFCASCGQRLISEEVAPETVQAPVADSASHAMEVAPSSVDGNTASPVYFPDSVPYDVRIAQEQQPSVHPYKKLGGFLAFIVYAYYVGAVLMVIAPIMSIVQLVSLSSQYGAYGSTIVGAAMGPLVLLLILYIAMAVFMCWWAGLIKKRNPSFLKIMHYLGAASIAILLIYGLVTGNANGSLLYALLSALSLFLWTLYYVKSVRVRTYFGSDEYLRQSPFTKNIQGPTPAVPD